MTLDDVKKWMAQCGAGPNHLRPPTYDEIAEVFLAVARLAVEADRERCSITPRRGEPIAAPEFVDGRCPARMEPR